MPSASNEHYAKCAEMYRKSSQKNPEWSYVFDSMAVLCDVLKIKSELGIKLKKAYDEGNKEALRMLAENDLAELEKYLVAYQKAIRYQWYRENKPFGFEVQDNRIGGLIARARDAKITLEEYLDGTLESIEQLEEARLYYDCRDENSDKNVIRHAVNWNANVSASLI